jgi:hypothetical protein
VKKAKKKEKSSARRMVALAGSFAAGAVLTWMVGVAGSNTARSEERLIPAQAAIEQAVSSADNSTDAKRVAGHSECDLQLD